MRRKGTGLRRKANESTEWNRRRLDAGISLRELEIRTGIHRTTLSMLEAGRLILTPGEAERLLAALPTGRVPLAPAAESTQTSPPDTSGRLG